MTDPDDAPYSEYDGGYAEDHAYSDTALEEHGDPEEAPARRRRRGQGCLPVLIALVVLAVIIVLGGRWVVGAVGSHFGAAPDYPGPGTGSVVFQVKDGSTSTQIGRELKTAGVVKSVDAFTSAARDNDKSRDIQVGYYQLKKQMKASDALDVLVDPNNLMQARVVVPEGARVRSIVKTIVAKTHITRQALTKALTNPATIGLPAEAKGNPEGYLFPATYSVPPGESAVQLLRQMVDKTVENEKLLDLQGKAAKLGYTPEQVLTVASILEYEANRSEDYPKVARVLYNRLAEGSAAPARLDGGLREWALRRRLDDGGRAGRQLGVQHLRAHGAPARPDRLAGRRDAQGRAEPGCRQLALLPAGLPARHHALLRQGRAAAAGRPPAHQGLLREDAEVLSRR